MGRKFPIINQWIRQQLFERSHYHKFIKNESEEWTFIARSNQDFLHSGGKNENGQTNQLVISTRILESFWRHSPSSSLSKLTNFFYCHEAILIGADQLSMKFLSFNGIQCFQKSKTTSPIPALMEETVNQRSSHAFVTPFVFSSETEKVLLS
jgi:hypothetical protein